MTTKICSLKLKQLFVVFILSVFSFNALYAQQTTGAETTYSIGLNPALGGYVFSLDATKKHGLVAETQDQGACYWNDAPALIRDAANHSTAGKNFTDWRLPTKDELLKMYIVAINIGGFKTSSMGSAYWSSSTAGNGIVAWYLSFFNGYYLFKNKLNEFRVRSVRAF